MSKIVGPPGYAVLAASAVQSDDVVLAVDIHDSTMASGGTTKQLRLADIPAAYGTMFVPPSGDTSGAADTAAIQAAMLSFSTLGAAGQGAGGVVQLAAGASYHTNKPLIVPSGVVLRGGGQWMTVIRLVDGSNCDVIQWATYNSSAQAAILGVSAASIHNAFYSGLVDLAIHGDSFGTTVAGYHHGVSIVTNPLNSVGSGDPEFDPEPYLSNVVIDACTGDGYYHAGRGGALLHRVISENNNGNGFSPTYDTTMLDCLAAFNQMCGFYFNHGSIVGSGCKSYNNKNVTWVSGHAYTAGNVVVSSGVMYFCTAAVSGATAPASDAAHWTALSATSPAAGGYGYYWDTNSAEHAWSAVDGQENSCGDYYFKGSVAAICVQGSSNGVNFDNGEPAFNGSNPNHYAAVTLDGATGVVAVINSSSQTQNGVICTILNSPGANTLIASTDSTEAALFNGGLPAYALVNGKLYTGTGIPVTGALITVPAALTFGTTIAVDASAGNDFRLTLTASTGTIGNPSNPADGQVIRFHIAQDTGGSRTVAWGTAYDFGAAAAPVLSTGGSKVDVVGFVYNAALGSWCYLGSGLGF